MVAVHMSRDDAGMFINGILTKVLSNLHLALRAEGMGFPHLCDSSLRTALLSAVTAVQNTGSHDDPVILKQMNHVTLKLQQAVEATSQRPRMGAAILEAAIAAVDAEAVISGAPPEEVFTGMLEDISAMYLAQPIAV